MDQLDKTTVASLAGVLLLLNSAFILSQRVLPKETPGRLRILFVWHAFDFLIHTIFEGSFLYNCFFASAPFDPATSHPSLITNFLKDPDRVYGSAYGSNWASQLWMVYAKADKRWGEADLTVISLELLTVFGAGPLALYICYGISKKNPMVGFWMVVLATGELYGGLFTPPLSLLMLVSAEAVLTSANRIYDLLSRMAYRKSKPRRKQLHVQMGLPRLLQHDLGLPAFVCDVACVWGHV